MCYLEAEPNPTIRVHIVSWNTCSRAIYMYVFFEKSAQENRRTRTHREHRGTHLSRALLLLSGCCLCYYYCYRALLFFFYCYYIFLCLYDRMCFDKRRLVSAWKLRKIGRELSASTFRVFISWRKFIRFFVLSFLLLPIWYNKCTPTLEYETMNRERRTIGEHFM